MIVQLILREQLWLHSVSTLSKSEIFELKRNLSVLLRCTALFTNDINRSNSDKQYRNIILAVR